MRPVSTIMVPIERARQFKAVATARGHSMVDLIEAVIASAISAGEIEDRTPGFRTEPNGKPGEVAFVIDTDGLGFPYLRASDARQIADMLDRIATGGKARKAVFGARELHVSKAGTGVVFVGKDDGTTIGRRTVTPSLARDLARQLRAAADAA